MGPIRAKLKPDHMTRKRDVGSSNPPSASILCTYLYVHAHPPSSPRLSLLKQVWQGSALCQPAEWRTKGTRATRSTFIDDQLAWLPGHAARAARAQFLSPDPPRTLDKA